MTREEAIDHLKLIKRILVSRSKDENGNRVADTKMNEAINMAIEALQNEPCEDTISRQAALKGIAEWVADGYADSEEDISHISGLVTHSPSVTPKPKTGKWLVYTDCEGKTRQCVCDQCGYKTGKYTWKNPNFCENCGTKMESESEDKE